MSYKVTRKTPVTLVIDDVEVTSFVGIAIPTSYGGQSRQLFGVVSAPMSYTQDQYLTHMCYGLDYFIPKHVLRVTEEHGGWFNFCSGAGCCEIRISRHELAGAFVALGLMDVSEIR